MALKEKIRRSEIYAKLASLEMGDEGNLLEIVSDVEAQLDFLRWCFLRGEFTSFVETGTNKGMFGLFLSFVFDGIRPVVLYTFDINPLSRRAIEILNQDQEVVDAHFFLGDSKSTLPKLGVQADFMWLDGHHSADYVNFELDQAARLQVPWVAVDDTNVEGVLSAAQSHQAFDVVGNPFLEEDERRPLLLVRKK